MSHYEDHLGTTTKVNYAKICVNQNILYRFSCVPVFFYKILCGGQWQYLENRNHHHKPCR